jgi:hypothetical protein
VDFNRVAAWRIRSRTAAAADAGLEVLDGLPDAEICRQSSARGFQTLAANRFGARF